MNGVVAIPHVESKGITHSFLPRCILSPSLLLWTLPVPGCSLLQYGTNSYIPKGAFVFLGAPAVSKSGRVPKSTLHT